MKVAIFSPDGKNFGQFMTPTLPQTRFFAIFPTGATEGHWLFIFSKSDIGFLYSPDLTIHGPEGPRSFEKRCNIVVTYRTDRFRSYAVERSTPSLSHQMSPYV